jgi:hypothetical protein
MTRPGANLPDRSPGSRSSYAAPSQLPFWEPVAENCGFVPITVAGPLWFYTRFRTPGIYLYTQKKETPLSLGPLHPRPTSPLLRAYPSCIVPACFLTLVHPTPAPSQLPQESQWFYRLTSIAVSSRSQQRGCLVFHQIPNAPEFPNI